MPKYRITRVYIVDAVNETRAKYTLDAWHVTGLDLYPVHLEWEGVRPELSDVHAWAKEFRDQLLGPRESNSQPAGKKSQS